MPAHFPHRDYHTPVLLEEAMAGLDIRATGTYVDATFGGGGHARQILEALGPEGRLIAFDQDEDAWKNALDDTRFTLVKENFRHLQRFLKLHGAIPVQGILADLGVSSHQFDTPERGFSTRQEALLDMRMDRRSSRTAADILRNSDEKTLTKIFGEYGEVPNARALARLILEARGSFPLKTVAELKALAGKLSRGNPARYMAQVFQALRIAVNDELGALQEFLAQAAEVLAADGRLVVITFHSLEDRIVKDFIRDAGHAGSTEDKPGTRLEAVHKKPVVPTATEITQNPRARSAKLRIARKTGAHPEQIL
jgi:16S rRNA (cytosine1402-N4)-methyltransferase